MRAGQAPPLREFTGRTTGERTGLRRDCPEISISVRAHFRSIIRSNAAGAAKVFKSIHAKRLRERSKPSVHADAIRRQRITSLEELLEIEYEKLRDFQQELAITASAPAKFELRQRLKREILPDIRKHEAEYAELLSQVAELESVPSEEAASTLAEVVQATEHLERVPATERPEELTRLLTDIRQKLDDPGKVAAAKLKVSLPLIPLIASYEMEIDTEAFMVKAWRRVRALFGAKV